MAKAVSEKSLPVLEYLMEHDGENLTAADIAIGMGMASADDEDSVKAAVKSVNGIVTAGLQRNKDLVERIPGEITLSDGTHKPVKFIKLTDAGKNYDHEAAKAQDAAEAK